MACVMDFDEENSPEKSEAVGIDRKLSFAKKMRAALTNPKDAVEVRANEASQSEVKASCPVCEKCAQFAAQANAWRELAAGEAATLRNEVARLKKLNDLQVDQAALQSCAENVQQELAHEVSALRTGLAELRRCAEGMHTPSELQVGAGFAPAAQGLRENLANEVSILRQGLAELRWCAEGSNAACENQGGGETAQAAVDAAVANARETLAHEVVAADVADDLQVGKARQELVTEVGALQEWLKELRHHVELLGDNSNPAASCAAEEELRSAIAAKENLETKLAAVEEENTKIKCTLAELKTELESERLERQKTLGAVPPKDEREHNAHMTEIETLRARFAVSEEDNGVIRKKIAEPSEDRLSSADQKVETDRGDVEKLKAQLASMEEEKQYLQNLLKQQKEESDKELFEAAEKKKNAEDVARLCREKMEASKGQLHAINLATPRKREHKQFTGLALDESPNESEVWYSGADQLQENPGHAADGLDWPPFDAAYENHGQVIHSGWISKKPVSSKWGRKQRRYLLLHPQSILWFKAESKLPAASGGIELIAASTVKIEGKTIQIGSRGRTLEFTAEAFKAVINGKEVLISEAQALQRWNTAIRERLRQIKGT